MDEFVAPSSSQNQNARPRATIKCGNEICPCAGSCGCPYGGCACEPDSPVETDAGPKAPGEPLASSNGAEPTSATANVVQDVPSSSSKQSTSNVSSVVNVNVGVLGHVNSGKTALVRALSTTVSTAALDKNPQSKERGMTLDLGFSSFVVPAPSHFPPSVERLQFTLVDAPGHASLFKTIINGAQIIDRMLLVIDATKGIQLQTAEAIVIGEILCDNVIVVLNKIDLLPEATREEALEKVKADIRSRLAATRFANCPMVAVAANVGGAPANPEPGSVAAVAPETGNKDDPSAPSNMNLVELVRALQTTTTPPERKERSEPLYFAVDHCFAVKGQGTVLTGTLLAGTVKVSDEIELPELKLSRKVKSIQVFKRPVSAASQGDRAALLVTALDASKVERCVACAPGTVSSSTTVLALVRKVKYFTRTMLSGSKTHVTLGPSTGLATVTFFGHKELRSLAQSCVGQPIPATAGSSCLEKGVQDWEFDSQLLSGGKQSGGAILQWALLEFDEPVVVPNSGHLIGSRLDTDLSSPSCRIAFYGRVAKLVPGGRAELMSVARVFKQKEKLGVVDRVENPPKKVLDPGEKVQSIVASGLFRRDADLAPFIGMYVLARVKAPSTNASGAPAPSSAPLVLMDECKGIIESPFGKTGKVKIDFSRSGGSDVRVGGALALRFKKYVLEPNNDKHASKSGGGGGKGSGVHRLTQV